MVSLPVSRKLAAIFYADVAGYSRLMGEAEERTHQTVSTYLDFMSEYIHGYRGRVGHFAGDAVLADFDSAVDAISCAVSVQRDLAAKNDELPDKGRVQFRIGINIGDVIVDRGEVHGDGVNVAARLEGLSEPGGVCVSESARLAVGSRLPVDYDFLGEQHVKNITDPVRAYHVRMRPGAVLPAPADETERESTELPTLMFSSRAMELVVKQACSVAHTDATVLVQGESGVGKELVARLVHEESGRRGGPFVKFDCAAVPADLFESELFGHVSGALTSATRDRPGRLELADGGTLFLDEVGELPLELQAKLLRPLQDSTFERVGDSRTLRADVRIVAATNRDLAELVSSDQFRRDLYFRLSVFPINVPPLRERSEDISVLVEYFLAQNAEGKTELERLEQDQLAHLTAYDWPGNVRELKNVVERALILSDKGALRFDDALPKSVLSFPARAPLPAEHTPARGYFTSSEFERLERNNLTGALEAAGWTIAGANGAATLVGMTPVKLRSRLKALNIQRPDPDSLYMRLGSARGISTLARDLFGRVQADPELRRFWARRSTYGVLREEKLLVDYVSTVSGGPAEYVGRDMAAAHKNLGITAHDWELFRTHFAASLSALRVPERESRELEAFAESLKESIVER
jgi:DNA-binding NtrC family response regulator